MGDQQPAGWYPAAHAGNELRYWDGTRWFDWTPEQAAEAANRPVPPAPAGASVGGQTDADEGQGASDRQDGTADAAQQQPNSRTVNSGKRTPLVVAGVVVAVIVFGGIAALAVALTQPSALQRAGDECSGSKPLTAFLDDVRSSASPTDADAPERDTSELDELFEGVVTVEDGGKTLIVNTKPQDDDAAGFTSLSLDCVYEQLEVPTSITARIGQTRALDGRQDGEWDGFNASWSYHPDSGANLIIVQK